MPAVLTKQCSQPVAGSRPQFKNLSDVLADELLAWLEDLERTGDAAHAGQTYECPLCARVSDRLWNMRRHAETHTSGKLSAMLAAFHGGNRVPHLVLTEVMRALYDHDVLSGRVACRIASRARALLASWTRFATTSEATGSLLSHLGKRDNAMALVFCASGPEFRREDDPRLATAKAFGPKQFYTQAFANALTRSLMQHGGVYLKALRAVRMKQAEHGCEVGQLLCRRSQTLAMLCCGLMESGAMAAFRSAQQATLLEWKEYHSPSVDATYKIGFKVRDEDRKVSDNWVTVVGLRGCPLGLQAAQGESPLATQGAVSAAVPVTARGQVVHVASDRCSQVHVASSLGGCLLRCVRIPRKTAFGCRVVSSLGGCFLRRARVT